MTLIEVMIALVILSVVMLSMGQYIAQFAHATATSGETSIASDLAAARLEQIKGSGSYATIESAFEGTETNPSGATGYTRETIVNVTSSSTAAYTTVTVEVTGPRSEPVRKTTVIASF